MNTNPSTYEDYDMSRSTTPQRQRIRALLYKCEYGMDRISLPHRSLAQRARLPYPEKDTPVDEWIDSLDTAEASALISKLAREAEHDHG